MKKLILAVMAVVLTACTTVVAPNYRALAKQVTPTNVELIGNIYNLWTGEVREDAAYCSGVAVSKTRIITAGHCTDAAKNVPAQQAQLLFDGKIKLRLSNGQIVLAKILASDFSEEKERPRDVALLEIIDAEAPAVAQLGNSDMVAVGDQLAIVGNTFGELAHSFTIGVVSFVGRSLKEGTFIQTDALSGGGNSGGPVFNMDGEVIGILVRGGGGVSLALPINDVITHLHEALKKS